MKKVLSLLLALVLIFSFCPDVWAIESLSDPIFFTWAWNANKIDADNSVTVVSWSGGSNSSYRSSFIVYDLPIDFTYEAVKTEVIASFAINKATLNNGTSQAPTAAIVMVDGDKVKEAYNLKSGINATNLLTNAKNNGVLLGTYKIGQYPRTSRIKNANINAFFEKHPDVKSIGFYVTNLASDGYEGTVNGIASAMSDFEVNFTAYQNYTNATVKMLDDKGNVLDTLSARDEIGTKIEIPEKIEKNGINWVRDNTESYFLSEDIDVIEVTYHDDKGDREKYVPVIEGIVDDLVKNPVSEKIDLPEEYIADDGFVIQIDWYSSDESVVSDDGTVHKGTVEQTAEIYAKIQLGQYTVVETKKFTVTVEALNQNETEEALIFSENFNTDAEKRGNFYGEGRAVNVETGEEFTISAFVRVDDLSKGGTIFNINGVKYLVSDYSFTEGVWYHVAVTDSAVYINGEKVSDFEPFITGDESIIGEYYGKMDNFYVFDKAFSKSLITELCEEAYDSPKIEIVSAYVIEGLDSALVRVASCGYEGKATIVVRGSDKVINSGYDTKEIIEGVNVFTVNVPNMEAGLNKANTTILLWGGIDTLKPLSEKVIADRGYDFGFNYTNPDNHMLSNTFTLKAEDKSLYLTSDGLSQRTDNGKWTAYVNKEGYYSLKNEKGFVLSGSFVFEQVNDTNYKIKNCDTNAYLSYGGNEIWTLSILEYDEISKAFASEGFMLLTEGERRAIYNATGQALNLSVARRNKLKELIMEDYSTLDGEAQAERLRQMLTYYPSYQINRTVNKSTTGVEAEYTLSAITWTTYEDIDGYSKSGYTATAVYKHEEGDVSVEIFARSQNVVRNIAKGFSFMPYQFIKQLKTVVDYNASNNQFKAEVGGTVYIETNYEVSSENVAITGAHELGHLVDFAGHRMSTGDYKTARETECSLSGYGNTALGEDFAEFCQAVISVSGDKELLRQLREMYPGRYDALCKGMCELYGECYIKLN